MKYKKEERLDIGRQIYNGEISRYEAADIWHYPLHVARGHADG